MMLLDRPLLACVLVLSGCVVPSIDAVSAAGQYSLNGNFGATASGSAVTSDLESLGLDDEEVGFQPRVDFRWLGMHLSVDYVGADFQGDGVAEATIEIGGGTISQDADVRTELELGDLKGAFTFDFIPGDTFELGLGVAVAALAFDLHMVEQNGAGEIETDETVPVPLLAGRFGLQLGAFRFYLDAGYADASIEEGDIVLADYELGASVNLFGEGSGLAGRLAGGWRGIDVDADYEDDESDVSVDFVLDGPFLGLALSF